MYKVKPLPPASQEHVDSENEGQVLNTLPGTWKEVDKQMGTILTTLGLLAL